MQVIAAATKIKLFANILWRVSVSTNTHFKQNTSHSSQSTHNKKVILGVTLGLYDGRCVGTKLNVKLKCLHPV